MVLNFCTYIHSFICLFVSTLISFTLHGHFTLDNKFSFEFCHNFFGLNLSFEFCQIFSFLVLSQFEFLSCNNLNFYSFGTICVLELSQFKFFFIVLSQLDFLVLFLVNKVSLVKKKFVVHEKVI